MTSQNRKMLIALISSVLVIFALICLLYYFGAMSGPF